MIKNSYPGKFIVFEGLDGSGSSTQIGRLSQELSKQFKVLVTKEPTANIIGGLIRGQLTGEWRTNQECLQLLFAADRAHHLEREVIPALKKGWVVLSDRYLFSSIAYGSLNLDKHWILEINKNFLMPDLTIILKVLPKECIRRMKKARFQLELFEEVKKLKSIWKTYQWLAKKFSRVKIFNGEKDKEEVFKNISEKLKKLKLI